MTVPNSYLLTAPIGSGDLLGRGIPATKIVRELKRIDKRVWASTRYGMDACLWVGVHGNVDNSKKISSIPFGVVPEFTQLGPTGDVIALGWRRIFEKCVKFGRIESAHIENAFKISMDKKGEDGFCFSCKKTGKLTRADSKGAQCSMHRQVLDTVAKATQAKADSKAQRSLICP